MKHVHVTVHIFKMKFITQCHKTHTISQTPFPSSRWQILALRSARSGLSPCQTAPTGTISPESSYPTYKHQRSVIISIHIATILILYCNQQWIIISYTPHVVTKYPSLTLLMKPPHPQHPLLLVGIQVLLQVLVQVEALPQGNHSSILTLLFIIITSKVGLQK